MFRKFIKRKLKRGGFIVGQLNQVRSMWDSIGFGGTRLLAGKNTHAFTSRKLSGLVRKKKAFGAVPGR